MVLGDVFSPDLIKIGLEGEDKEEVFEELIELYVSRHPEASRAAILAAVKTRESKLSTGIKPGIAIPHAQTAQIPKVTGLIGISRNGIDYDALDGNPVHLVFMLLNSVDSCALHLRVLKRLALLIENPLFYQNLVNQKDPESVYQAVRKYEDILTTSM